MIIANQPATINCASLKYLDELCVLYDFLDE